MQYVSHSSYLVSIEARARLIYIYETTVKQSFASDCVKSCHRAQKYQKISGGMPPDPPRAVPPRILIHQNFYTENETKTPKIPGLQDKFYPTEEKY